MEHLETDPRPLNSADLSKRVASILVPHGADNNVSLIVENKKKNFAWKMPELWKKCLKNAWNYKNAQKRAKISEFWV